MATTYNKEDLQRRYNVLTEQINTQKSNLADPNYKWQSQKAKNEMSKKTFHRERERNLIKYLISQMGSKDQMTFPYSIAQSLGD